MRAEGFLISLANTLGVPLGSKRRPADGKYENTQVPTNDFVNSILDITRDDVCIGENPLFYKSNFKRLPKVFKGKLDDLLKELNSIIGWAALDILKTGTSIFTITLSDDNKVKFIPYLNQVDVFLDSNKNVVIVSNNKVVEDVLIFLFYEKDMLEPVKIESLPDVIFRVRTVGLSLKNARKALEDLAGTERFISGARTMSRIVRYATVEIGVGKSDRQTEIVDDVSDGLNANSMDLANTDQFDDQIPIFPTTKGVGAPTLTTDAPDFNLGDLGDLDYNLSKVFLSLRFPKTYADFSTNLSPTAVSLIRGDIRYAKLLVKARSILENTINNWISSVDSLRDKGITFYLTALPTPEADDVTTTLQSFTQFSTEALQFIIAENKEASLSRLTALTSLFAQETNIKSVERWSQSIKDVIDKTFPDQTNLNVVDQPPGTPAGGDLEEGVGEEIEEPAEGAVDLTATVPADLDNLGV